MTGYGVTMSSLRDELRSMDLAERLELLGSATILMEVQRMSITVDQLVSDFRAFRDATSLKLQGLADALQAAHSGGVPQDIQDKINELDSEINTASQSIDQIDNGGVTNSPPSDQPAPGQPLPVDSTDPTQATQPTSGVAGQGPDQTTSPQDAVANTGTGAVPQAVPASPAVDRQG